MPEPVSQYESVRKYANLQYGPEETCYADVYLPPESWQRKNAGQISPLVVYIHGGGWHIGHKSAASDPARRLAREGFVVVTPSYSQSHFSQDHLYSLLWIQSVVLILFAVTASTWAQTLFIFLGLGLVTLLVVGLWLFTDKEEIRHPTHVHDIARSVRWAQSQAPTWQADPQRTHLIGHSAGGHLASLLATNHSYLQKFSVDINTIRSCTSISGVYSDQRLQETATGRALLTNAFGHRQSYMDAFPIYHVTPETPPFMLLNGGSDLGLKRHTLDFHYTLMQRGVYVRTMYFNERSHWNIATEWDADGKNHAVADAIVDFLREVDAPR